MHHSAYTARRLALPAAGFEGNCIHAMDISVRSHLVGSTCFKLTPRQILRAAGIALSIDRTLGVRSKD